MIQTSKMSSTFSTSNNASNNNNKAASPAQSHRFQDRMGDLTHEFPTSDVTFLVQVRHLHFNRHVLAFHSPVFQVMLFGSFAEGRKNEIPVEEMFDEFQNFLCQMKPAPHKLTVNDDNVEYLLKLSDKYEVAHVLEFCCKFILDRWADRGNKVMTAIELAFKYKLEKIAERFLPLGAARPLKEINAFHQRNRDEVFADEIFTALLNKKLLDKEKALKQSGSRQSSPFCELCGEYDRLCNCASDVSQEFTKLIEKYILTGA